MHEKPPYQINSQLLTLLTKISELLGEVNALHLIRPEAELRKSSRIKTIHASLAIEGNTLTEQQITALLNNKKVIAPKKDILEVQNAIAVYNQLGHFNPFHLESLLKAHNQLMAGLIADAGKLRRGAVGIVKGDQVTHVAPPGNMVRPLMDALFQYALEDEDPMLIKSCVFHYELEFIHPFVDGNGRMGRLWQTALLMTAYPLFEFIPIENLIKAEQQAYYRALNESDNAGNSTPFIVFMLDIIRRALVDLLDKPTTQLDKNSRMLLFQRANGTGSFSRKDYLRFFKGLSQATASRDLKEAVDIGILVRDGDKRTATYRFR